MNWSFQSECDILPSDETWIDLVLAPLASVAASNGWDDGEEHLVANTALSRGLIPARIEPSSSSIIEAVSSFRRNPHRLSATERALTDFLARLPSERARLLIDRIYDAMLAVAMESPCEGPERTGLHLDKTESDELNRYLKVLLSAGEASETRGTDSKPRSAAGVPPQSPPPLPAPSSLPPSWIWADGWNRAVADRCFETLGGMHEAHEEERRRGRGRLDGAATIADASGRADAVDAWCDEGIAVAPLAWSDLEIWICGDLHGDGDSLSRFLSLAGVETDPAGADLLPEGRALVFLGDLGDRGHGTLSVWLRVAELKRNHPGRVQILRGNHEEVRSVRLARKDGTFYERPWFVPSTTDSETYFQLGLALLGKLENLELLFNELPDAIVLPGGWLAVHGALPPRWKDNDGWPGEAAGVPPREALEVSSFADLRKEAVRGTLRWTDAIDRPEVDFGWAGIARGSRLFAALADFEHWQELLGEFRLVHGHTHPAEGARYEWSDRSLALNSSRHTAPRQGAARLRAGTIDLHDLRGPGPLDPAP